MEALKESCGKNTILSFVQNISRLWIGSDISLDKKKEVISLLHSVETLEKRKEKWVITEGLTYLPSILMVNITSRCNLKCIGCYFEKNQNKSELSYTQIDNIIAQAKEFGIFIFIIIGGEPFLRSDLIKLIKEHKDVIFLIFTNGTTISKNTLQPLSCLANVMVLLSVEGFKKETDTRRGMGVYDTLIRNMKYLQKEEILFGFSATVTRKNFNTVMSEIFIDEMIRRGCKAGWYVTYIHPDSYIKDEFSLDIELNGILKEKIDYLRKMKKIILAQFPENDKCSAGEELIYINTDGTVTLCPFLSGKMGNIQNERLKTIIKRINEYAGITKRGKECINR